MRVLYYSDIHIEGGRPKTWDGPEPICRGPDLSPYVGNVDLLVLAGDIGSFARPDHRSSLKYAASCVEYLDCPVVLVPGNHEYYGGTFGNYTFDDMRAANVFVLDRDEIIIDGLRVLGATLWTDYKVNGNQLIGKLTASNGLNDHRMIRTLEGKLWTPNDALAEHHLSRDWLLEKLTEPFDGNTIIVTHHVPHSACGNPNFPIDNLAGCFMSDCDDLIEAAADVGVAGWIFGHHHFSAEWEVGGVPMYSAQLGYWRENTGWVGPGVIEI